MSEQYQDQKSTGKGGIVAAVVITLVIVGGVLAWWLSTQSEDSPAPTPSPSASASASPSPSLTPSSSPTPSPTATASAPSMADMDGRWCSAAPDARPDDCITVALPWVESDGEEAVPLAVSPWDADPADEPESFDYSGPPNAGGCWVGSIDFWPGESGAPLLYCPAGADPGNPETGDWSETEGPIDQERLWPGTQDGSIYDLYLRVETE